VEFVKLNFDFHPHWMMRQLRNAGFDTRRTLAVSYLRVGTVKRLMPVQWMVVVDAVLQRTAPLALLSPSVFTLNVRAADGPSVPRMEGVPFEAILQSPRSGAPLRREGDVLVCDADGTRWQARGNFYDLKEPL
jgi:hypothetical protein